MKELKLIFPPACGKTRPLDPHHARALQAALADAPAPAPMTKEEWVAAFVACMVEHAPFTHFDDGTAVEDYAREIAPNSFDDVFYRRDSPEAAAQGDMDYWGEE